MARLPPVTREHVREDLRSIFDDVSSGPGGEGQATAMCRKEGVRHDCCPLVG